MGRVLGGTLLCQAKAIAGFTSGQQTVSRMSTFGITNHMNHERSKIVGLGLGFAGFRANPKPSPHP